MSFKPILDDILEASKRRLSLTGPAMREQTITFHRHCPITRPPQMDEYSYHVFEAQGPFAKDKSHHTQMRIAESDTHLKAAFARFEEEFDQMAPFQESEFRMNLVFKGQSRKIRFQIGSTSINDVNGGYAARNMPGMLDDLSDILTRLGLNTACDTWWDLDEAKMIFRAPSAEKALMIHHIFTNLRKITKGETHERLWLPNVRNISKRADIEANFQKLHATLFPA